MAMQTTPSGKIDRRTTVPFLLKLYYNQGSFHRLDNFSARPTSLPHVEIYSWPSCTLRELSHLLTSALPALLPQPVAGTRLSYRLVYPDSRDHGRRDGALGRFLSKELGSIVVGDESRASGVLLGEGNGADEEGSSAAVVRAGPVSGRLGGDPEKTLQDARFIIGDYVSCAIYPPGVDAEDGPPPASYGGRPRYDADAASGREPNGYGGGRGGYRGRGGRFGGREPTYGRLVDQDLLRSEWRRGERIPDAPSDRGRAYGRGRGRPW